MKALLPMLTVLVLVSPFAHADRQADCERKIEVAQEAGIIHRMNVDSQGVHVVVDSGTWTQMPYTTKLGLASTVECAIAGPDKRLTAVLFHDHRTNKVIGRYTYPQLEML